MKTKIMNGLKRMIIGMTKVYASIKTVPVTIVADLKRIGLLRRRDIWITCAVAMVIAIFGIWQTATAAYDVTVDGETVMVVKNLGEAEEAIDNYIHNQQEQYGESATLRENIAIDRKVGADDEEVKEATVLEEVLPEVTTTVADGVQLMVDGNPTVIVTDEEAAQSVLAQIEADAVSELEGANVQAQGFRQDITMKRVTTDAEEIVNVEEAASTLSQGTAPALQWEVVFEYRVREPIEPGVEIIETEALPAGNKEVEAEGVPGEQERLLRAISLNGEVVATETVESTVLQEAVPSVVYEGKRTAAVATASRSSLSHTEIPISGNITATFGQSGSYWQSSHTGLDIAASSGTKVRAALSGTVIEAGWEGAYGNMITIEHEDGMVTRYAHLSSIGVNAGDEVKRGDVIGACGSTGNTTGPHLHFEVLIDGEFQNPTDYF